MRSCLQVILLAFVFQAATAFAIEFNEREICDLEDIVYDNGYLPGIICHACRDPSEYPEDYAALIYNGFFGEDPWLSGWRLGLPIRIYDADMNYVLVWFDGVLFDPPSLLPNLMEIHVRLPNGVIVTLIVLQDGPDMPIGGDQNGPSGGSTSPCNCDGDGDNDEDEDPYENGKIPEWKREP